MIRVSPTEDVWLAVHLEVHCLFDMWPRIANAPFPAGMEQYSGQLLIAVARGSAISRDQEIICHLAPGYIDSVPGHSIDKLVIGDQDSRGQTLKSKSEQEIQFVPVGGTLEAGERDFCSCPILMSDWLKI